MLLSIFREFSMAVFFSRCISLRGVRCGGLLVTTVCAGPEQRTRLHSDVRKRVDGRSGGGSGANQECVVSEASYGSKVAPCCILLTILDII